MPKKRENVQTKKPQHQSPAMTSRDPCFTFFSKEDESYFPANFEEDIMKKATIIFDWNNKKIVKDEKTKAKKERNCLRNIKRLFDNDNRRLVSAHGTNPQFSLRF